MNIVSRVRKPRLSSGLICRAPLPSDQQHIGNGIEQRGTNVLFAQRTVGTKLLRNDSNWGSRILHARADDQHWRIGTRAFFVLYDLQIVYFGYQNIGDDRVEGRLSYLGNLSPSRSLDDRMAGSLSKVSQMMPHTDAWSSMKRMRLTVRFPISRHSEEHVFEACLRKGLRAFREGAVKRSDMCCRMTVPGLSTDSAGIIVTSYPNEWAAR